MALSDDVASLKLEIHKLAVAIEELAIKRYSQGEIGISNLPWFTSQYVPGDSIKLSGNRLPAATYLDNNEVIASSTSSFSNTSSTFLGAHQVFEKMPEPMLSSNNDKVAVIGDRSLLNEIDEIKPGVNGVPEPYIDDVPDYVRTAHKLFHTMPVPDFILEMAKVAKTTQEENEEMADAHQLFDTMPEPTEQANANQTICQAEVINNEIAPSNVFEELPLPDFIKEMVEAAKIAELNSAQGDSDTICEDSDDDSLAYKQNFAKLGTLDGPYFPDLVILGASGGRFSRLQSVVLMGNQTSDQLLLTDELYDRNLTPKCPLFQVKTDSPMVFYSLTSMSLAKNVVLLLLLGDKDGFLDSSLSKIFEVRVYNTIVSDVGRKMFFSFKELQSWGINQVWWDSPLLKLNEKCVSKWCDTMIPSLKCISSLAYINSLLKHNFDHGGKRLEVRLKGCDEGLIDNLYSEWTLYHKEIMPQVKIFDPGLVVRDVVKVLHVTSSFLVMSCKSEGIGTIPLRCCIKDGYTTFAIMIAHDDIIHYTNVIFQTKAFDTCIIKKVTILSNVSNSICGTFPSNFIFRSLTLEDKGDFEEVGNDMGLALWWRMSSLICIRNHLATNGSILMPMTGSSLCFDPGGLYNKFCVKILIGLLRVATCIESTSVRIFDPGDIGDLSGSTSVMSTLYPVYGTSIHSFTATNDNGIWPKEFMKTKRHIRLEKSPLLCNAFFSDCKSRRGEIIQVFIWDPGNIIMIVLELLTKSNKKVGSPRCSGASSGARANGCLLGIVKQIWCSTPLVLLENASEGAVKFTFYQRLSNYVKLVLITFDLRRTTCSNEYGWRYVTLNCDMPMIGQISSLVFDPGGQKYNLSLVESLTSRFVQTTAIFLSCCLAQLNLLQSSDCADHEGAILVFDPGGCGNGQKVMEQPKACQYGGGRRLKSKGNEDHQIYVFDPGGQLMRFVIKAMVTNSQPGVYYAMSCFKY